MKRSLSVSSVLFGALLLSACSPPSVTVTGSGAELLDTATRQVQDTVELTKQGVEDLKEGAETIQERANDVREGIDSVRKGADQIKKGLTGTDRKWKMKGERKRQA